MDTVFIKRFIKYNKSLMAVIGVSLLVVLFLLVIAIVKYLEMVEANNEVNQMRTTIQNLQDPMQNQVSVIEGNLKLLEQDLKFYREKNAIIKPFFGQPYRQAVNMMAQSLGMKSGEELVKKFYDFLDASDQNESVNIRFRRFRMDYEKQGNLWSKASKVFIREAQKVSFEIIDDSNVDDIFLQAIGFPREISGRTVDHCRDILKNNSSRLNKLVLDKNIGVSKDTADFSLMSIGLNSPQQIADSMQNMEIISDMVSRIVKALPSDAQNKTVRMIEMVKFIGKNPYPEDNKITVFKYNVKLIGTMDALRRIIAALNSAITESRVYVIRDLKLQMPLKDDEAAVVVGLVEPEVLVDKDGKKIEIKFKDDSHLPYQQRRDYGKVLIGSKPFFEIEFEVDYLILKQYEYQKR